MLQKSINQSLWRGITSQKNTLICSYCTSGICKLKSFELSSLYKKKTQREITRGWLKGAILKQVKNNMHSIVYNQTQDFRSKMKETDREGAQADQEAELHVVENQKELMRMRPSKQRTEP